jgi:hypothetical protein
VSGAEVLLARLLADPALAPAAPVFEAVARGMEEGWGAEVSWPRGGPAPGRPLLEGARVSVLEAPATRLARVLSGARRPSAEEVRAALEEAVAAAGRPPEEGRLDVLAAPLLRAARVALGPRVPDAWPDGRCAACGGPALLAESRGLARERRLRCVGCGGDGAFPWFRCPACGTDDHALLATLTTDDPSVRVDACRSCRSWVKTLSTLAPVPDAELHLRDAATAVHDLAAIERGYERARPLVAPLGLRVAVRGRR